MARIIREVEVEGNRLTALFDSGSNNTYIRGAVAPPTRIQLRRPFTVGLGGDTREIREICVFEGEIEGLGFASDSYVIDEIGTADGHRLDMIVGARTMEGWEIKLDPSSGELDLTGLRRREFTEY